MKHKITTQKLHKIIRDRIGKKCSKFSLSQKIDRTSYGVCTYMRGVYGIFSGQHIAEIAGALTENAIAFDESKIDRGIIVVEIMQEWGRKEDQPS